MGCSKNSSKGKVYSNIFLPQKTRKKILNKQRILTPKAIRARRKKQNTMLVDAKNSKNS